MHHIRLKGAQQMITMTDKAAKAAALFIKGSDMPAGGLRIAITGGGCSGYTYNLSIEPDAADGDTVVEHGKVRVFLDPASAPLLEGVTIDFAESLESSGFTFINPNASASCGCGKSFSA
jgi:iron-sulfur cluster assembly accessory protein